MGSKVTAKRRKKSGIRKAESEKEQNIFTGWTRINTDGV
jgi:hypothetical protein